MPALQNLYNSYRNDKRIVFLFINEDSDPDKAKMFLKKKGYDFPIFTSAGQLSQKIFSGTLPTTVILDKKGMLIMKHEGVGNFSGKKFSDELQAIL
jgi:hypothetical protein